jgi:hypothetical protein
MSWVLGGKPMFFVEYISVENTAKVWECLLEGYNGYGKFGKLAKIQVKLENSWMPMLVSTKVVIDSKENAEKYIYDNYGKDYKIIYL